MCIEEYPLDESGESDESDDDILEESVDSEDDAQEEQYITNEIAEKAHGV